MTLTFRHRILFTLIPLVILLAALGGTGVVLLSRLGGQIDTILRENYESIGAMERLNEALERIDSSFQFALAGREEKARQQYDQNWMQYRTHLERQQLLTAVPGEAELVDRLIGLTDRYQRQGDAFFSPSKSVGRRGAYFGENGESGLLSTFKEIKVVSDQILSLNQQDMERANRDARHTARQSLIWFGIGLATAMVLAVLLGLHTVRVILRPVQAVTQSALAIGSGNLDQVVPIMSEDELGKLARAFNTMARQLRAYCQSQDFRLLRAQQTSQSAIDSFPQPVLVVDCDGHVEMANPSARQTLGVVPGKTQLATAQGVHLPGSLWESLAEALRNHRGYHPKRLDQAIPLCCGAQECFFLPRILPITDPQGNTAGAAVLLEDVTQLRLLDRLKSDLVATASHELKTPLATIRLAIHWLLDETLGPLTTRQTEVVQEARDNAERLLVTIDNLLDLARLEQGRQSLDLRPEPPLALLRAAWEASRRQAEEKGVEIVVDAAADLPRVRVDAEAMGHALINLIDNAVAYTSQGGRIALTASSSGNAVTLSVADTGVGIPPEYLPHVFDKFFRVPGQPKRSGTGLGLAIAREILTAHGGSIHCDSHPGQGTTFRLSLPAVPDDRIENGESVKGRLAPLQPRA